MIQVEAILFASLAISLFSAFLAMLGKQWLNRYQSADMRGSVIERSHSRQQKLGGIVGWYFDHVMESLPWMLQAALLLLGCALSRYLWETNVAIASVVVGVTSFGVIFYLFIVISGTISESFPYQTPAARICRHTLHHLRHHVLPALRSASSAVSCSISSGLSRFYQASWCLQLYPECRLNMKLPWYSTNNAFWILMAIFSFPIALAFDVHLFGRTLVRLLISFCRIVHNQLVGGPRITRHWFIDIYSLRTLALGEQIIVLDLQCVSWILRISLDKAVHLSAFRHLMSMPKLAYFDPTLVFDCFNIFVRCIAVSNGKVVIIQGLEQLATASASGFSRTLHHLVIMDPASRVLADLRQRYNEVFPSELDSTSLSFHSTMVEIHALAGRFGNPRDIRWYNHRMSIQEHIPFARRMVHAARERYQRTPCGKVPRWILRSALYFLSLDLTSPPSVVADCLTIIAIDLGCDVPNGVISDESARVEFVSNPITQKLEIMVEAADRDLIFSKRKAISTLLPYAIFLEQGGQQGMMNAIIRGASVSDSKFSYLRNFVWHHVSLYISRLFEKRTPTSLNRIITLVSPYVPWEGQLNNTIAVSRWATAALETPYTEEVGRSVVIALFQIASIDLLRPHIPIEIWMLLKRRPPLPLAHRGRRWGTHINTVAYVRGLGDIELLKSYLFLVFADRCIFPPNNVREIETSIREDFGGVGMEHHRKDLIEQLDEVRASGISADPTQFERVKRQRKQLRDVLLEVDGRLIA